ncbi:MAG: NADH-quinone oxidoreductase subunit NuoN [Rhodospirillales bacterium]|nr:NADH-quinone oxidoreductase subunit NuoN [Rhodospirillales bacterium]MCB9995599.1 NADH-quinone oxidoreductase subunit NuoN [Rhodospirillales bacterium]
MTDASNFSLMPALPEVFLALAGMVLLVAGVFRGNEGTRLICWATVGAFGVAAMFLLGLNWEQQITFGGLFIMDRFAGFMKLLVLIGLMLSMAISVRYLAQERINRFEYPILVLFAGLGMMFMISSNSLLTMYMGLELQSLSLYVLAAFRRDYIKSAEAGIKYFILGALASGMLLFGVSLVYGYTGSVGFTEIAAAVQAGDGPSAGLVIGLVFVLAGLAFKVSAVPFHMWTPDVYEGAPTSVTAFFAIVPKIAAMALLMRLLYGPFGSIIGDWQQIIWFLALASMIVGSFAAIAQTNIKRLMAYSSIGNMGYALIGVASGTVEGAGAVVLYLTIYMFMTAGVFAVILMMRRGGMEVDDIEDLGGLSKNSPLLAYALAILMFSMSGIPPMAGFFGKFFIFQAAIASEMYVLATLGILTSVVAAFYYLRVIKVMFFDDPVDVFDKQIAFSKRAVVLMSVVFVLLFIKYPDGLVQTSLNAASALFAG